MHVRNIAQHDVDTDDGQLIGAGSRAEVDPSDRITELIEAGLLVEIGDGTDAPASAPADPTPVTEAPSTEAAADDKAAKPAAGSSSARRRGAGAGDTTSEES